ncbi:hypothetical protein V1511DRAFT_500257 [Dipodascopsis uninucleata]
MSAPVIAPKIKPESLEQTSTVNCIRMSKEWVLPPRPKPGRKPSQETPPTKRKAQNRAAQRAFRERRAARVFELEERLMELETEKEEMENNLSNTLLRISSENQQLKSVTEELKQQLELFKIFQAQQQAVNHLASPAPSPGSNHDPVYSQDLLDRALEERLPVDNVVSSSPGSTVSPHSSSFQSPPSSTSPVTSVPLKRSLENSQHHYSARQANIYKDNAIHTANAKSTVQIRSSSSIGHSHAPNHLSPLTTSNEQKRSADESCGLCHNDGNCMCSDLGLKPATDMFPPKESDKAAALIADDAHKSKRSRASANDDDVEMDFTHAFKTTKINIAKKDGKVNKRESDYDISGQNDFSDVNMKAGSIDPCGFCSSGTPCICAEAAGSADHNSSVKHTIDEAEDDMGTTLPPIRNYSQSSLVQPNGPNKLVTLHPEPIHTPNNNASIQKFSPGTCESCQRDPMQTLFCTSLASKSKGNGGGCGGCPGTNGGCCGGNKSTSNDGAFIPCSAAYQTLSRHKGFKAVELPSLVGKLSTREGQVEVSSIASILRELDRRLYN